jgi:CHAD domain-containing protein
MAKAWKTKGVSPSDPFRDAAKTIVATKYAELLSHVPRALDDPDDETIHDMRISAKRLREVLNLLRDGLSKKRVKPARDAVDQLNDALGEVRDCDVFLRWVDDTSGQDLADQELAALDAIREMVEIERDNELDSLRAAMDDLLEDTLPEALSKLVGRARVDEVIRRHG